MNCLNFYFLYLNHLMNFVDSCWIQDRIRVEEGYHDFAPALKMLSQHKYLKLHFNQLDTLNKSSPTTGIWSICMN